MNKRNISDRAGGSSRTKPIINNEKRKKNEDTTKRTNQKGVRSIILSEEPISKKGV